MTTLPPEATAGRIPRLDEELCDPMDKLMWQIIHALEVAVAPSEWLQARGLLCQFEGITAELLSARSRIEELEKAQAWQDIETAPKDGTPVDLWCRAPGLSAGPGRVTDCWFSIGYWWRYDDSSFGDDQCRSRVHNATHWKELPPPPTKAGKV